MIRYVTALVAALVLLSGGITSANQLPDDRSWVTPYQACEYYKEGNWTVRICAWGTANLPRRTDMREIIAILQRDYGDDEHPFYTTVMIEPSRFMSPILRGAYLPATGNIIVGYPANSDVARMMHTIAHELLHAWWDVVAFSFDKHHTQLYCNGALGAVEEFLDKYVDPKQVPRIKDRAWVGMGKKLEHCIESGSTN